MQSHNFFFLLLGMAIVAVVETARVDRAVTASIRFCNELDYDSPCITQELIPGKCHDLPDSAAKGDQGSSIYFSGINKKGDISCEVFTSKDCKQGGSTYSEKFQQPFWFGKNWDKAIAKSYKCNDHTK
ncbi:hypothetical protein LTR70_003575 [Exophiala xenobiotica]|uniref:Uncharacterized protein n=1 Tax=Lithohypha guttulata TaxID=1690604 RepID=A0ABR0KGD4_9EURO|nr:hypothetical protein LTR24_003123 [Lithohypha guttulata]KAK5322954.1 hypothetical protein LTR70_003575 [Exophiala xenobiotica]